MGGGQEAAPSFSVPLLGSVEAERDRSATAVAVPPASPHPSLDGRDLELHVNNEEEEEGTRRTGHRHGAASAPQPPGLPPSFWSKQETLEPPRERPPVAAHLQTDAQTVLNTINLYVGVGLLSTGYAVRLGGWGSLLVLAATTLVFSCTAKLLCYAFDELPPGAPPSYPALGRAAFGAAGQWGVTAAVLLEFWGALGMCLIVLWQNLAMLLPPVCLPGLPCLSSSQAAILLSTAAVLPAVLARSLAKLTSISLSGVAGSVLLTAVVVVAYLLDPRSALVPAPHAHEHRAVDLKHLPLAAGIFIVSLSGHAGLPSLRRSMARPENFEKCINITFSCMFLLYAAMGGVAYAYFGESLQVLVTGSLNSGSSVAGVLLLRAGAWSLSLSQALTVLVALSVYSTIPAESWSPRRAPRSPRSATPQHCPRTTC